MDSTLSPPIPPIFSLPEEILQQLLVLTDLECAFAISSTCSRFRSILTESQSLWTLLILSETNQKTIEFASRHSIVPAQSWIRPLQLKDRKWILAIELPKLMNDDWKEICTARFPRSFLEDVCNYVVIHRASGLSANRISHREFSPVEIFRILREQNATTKLIAAMITVPPYLSPIDTEIKIYYTRAPATPRPFLINLHGTSLLNSIYPLPDFCAVGPVLITSTLREYRPISSPILPATTPPRYYSFDISDLFRLLEQLNLHESWSQMEIKRRNGWN